MSLAIEFWYLHAIDPKTFWKTNSFILIAILEMQICYKTVWNTNSLILIPILKKKCKTFSRVFVIGHPNE